MLSAPMSSLIFDYLHASTVYGGIPSIQRDDRIGIALEMSIDKLLMIMFSRRSVLSTASVSHVISAINITDNLIKTTCREIRLNDIEKIAFDQLNDIEQMLLRTDDTVARVMVSLDIFKALFERCSAAPATVSNIISAMKLIFAMANQTNYQDTSFVLPSIRILSGGAPYFKSYEQFNCPFELTVTPNRSIDACWYSIFRGVKLSSDPTEYRKQLLNICATINIGTLPDARTGNRLTRFIYEEVASSPMTRTYVEQVQGLIADIGNITTSLANGANFSTDKIKLIGTLEADTTDSDSLDKEQKTDDGGAKTTEPTDTGTADGTDSPDAADPPSDPASEDPQLEGDTPPADDPTAGDNSSSDASSDNNPSDDGLDNASDNRPAHLGWNLQLPKDETLDSFFYKLSVARMIDNVIEYNHDELPLETVSTLRQWKSMFLFLADVEETVKLLKELKIKL